MRTVFPYSDITRFNKMYGDIITQIKSEKGKDHIVTLDEIKRRVCIKDVPWSNCLGFTVK